jgi:TPR repeat protein
MQQAARPSGFLYEVGEVVRKVAARAAALFEQACDGGFAAGCNNLGRMYEAGEGVPKDATRAAALYRRACDGGYTAACK